MSGPLDAVRNGLGQWLRGVRPEPGTLRTDAVAGIPGAIGSVPDGMASATLVGVSPVFGLYASMAGPIGGGLTSSTRLMVITTTSAAALAAGSVLAPIPAADRPGALVVLVLVAGGVMALAGLLRLGRYTRFVSHSVMIGFLTGVGVNIIAGQVPDLLGAEAEGGFALARAWDVVTHPAGIDVASALAGAAAIVILVVLARTPLANFAAIVALAVPTLVVVILGITSVATVADVGEIPAGFPLPVLPKLSDVSLNVLAGALAIAAIVLVQGSGVAESAPNRDGSRSSANQDFIAQGAGNLASGLFNGIPVGGSVGQTALNISAGARSRWAAIFCGLWMLLIIVALGWLVGSVVMPTLAAVLIVAAAGSFRITEIGTVWRTGRTSQIAIATTFVATLVLPVAAAVGIGVALSLLLQLNRDAMDLRVVELVPRADGRTEERPAPRTLESRHVTVLDVYGSLFYAGARTLEARLPSTGGADTPAVVIRMRGRTTVGATAIRVLDAYAHRLSAAGGRLYLSGVEERIAETIRRSRDLPLDGPLQIMAATSVIGESTDAAAEAARAWIEERTASRA